LLGVFASGLLLAVVIVTGRSRIVMSDPIELAGAGLSVSVPVGNGWSGSTEWTYIANNEFITGARLDVGSQVAAVLQCRYMVSPTKTEAQKVIEEEAEKARMQIVRSGSIAKGDIEIEWAQLDMPRRTGDTYLGAAVLPSGKILEIDVRAPNDSLLASKLFQAIAGSIAYREDERVRRGIDFVERIRTVGIDSVIARYGGYQAETAYLISDSEGRAKGFLIRILTRKTATNDWSAQKIESIRYVSGAKGDTVATSFELSNNLDRFFWRTVSSTMQTLPAKTELDFSVADGMRVSSGRTGDRTYKPGSGAIPQVCLDIIMPMFLDSGEKEAVIEVVFSTGQIVPALMSVADVSGDPDNEWQAAYGVKLELLTTKGARVQTYFDPEKRLVGNVEISSEKLIWRKTTRQELKEQFGNLERYLGQHGVLQ
jgi:hypothetical protein